MPFRGSSLHLPEHPVVFQAQMNSCSLIAAENPNDLHLLQAQILGCMFGGTGEILLPFLCSSRLCSLNCCTVAKLACYICREGLHLAETSTCSNSSM